MLTSNHVYHSTIYFSGLFQGRISSWITQMEQQQGIKLYTIPFGDEFSNQQYNKHLHTICLEGNVTIEFQLLSQMHRKFRIRNAQDVCKEVYIIIKQ